MEVSIAIIIITLKNSTAHSSHSLSTHNLHKDFPVMYYIVADQSKFALCETAYHSTGTTPRRAVVLERA